MAPNDLTDHEMIVDERDRLIRLESRFDLIGTIAKLLWTLFLLFIVQISGGIYAFSQLAEKVNNLDLKEMKQNVSTVLVVLGDHGTEIQTVRTEQQRLRGNIDSIRRSIDDKTKERFYKSDGDKLDERTTRLEEAVFFKPNGAP